MVTGEQQALVVVDIVDGEDLLQPIEVILDTGFTDYLTLPSDSIQELGLPSVGRRTFELANGELFEFDAHLATVEWHGRLSDALVLKSDSAPLLGMTLFWGSRVTVDALADGQVTIEELEPEG